MLSAARTLTAISKAIPTILNQPGLIAVAIKGKEALNTLFSYEVMLKTPDSLAQMGAQAADIDLQELIGQEMTVEIELEGNGTFIAGMVGNSGMGNVGQGKRQINGIITAAKVARQVGRYVYYAITIEPWLKLASYGSDCRIFQDKTPLQIIDEVLSKYNFSVEKRLFDPYDQVLDYTTQYNESDFSFFSRICERFGINYFFEHKDGIHTLILADANQAHKPNPEAYVAVPFRNDRPKIDQEYISQLTPTHRLTAGIFNARDYDYTRPSSTWDVSNTDPKLADHAEVYTHHHINYVQPKAGAGQIQNEPLIDGKYLARLNRERLANDMQRAQGSGALRGMVTGCTYKQTEHPTTAANTNYLIIATDLIIEEVGQETQRAGAPHQQFNIHCDFEVVPLQGNSYRPERITPIPVMLTAVARVVGPENQPVWTDALGRIKIQFVWDRRDLNNENSSCWIRADQLWSGNQLGMTFIARIGSEVIVNFIGGNPDLPIVIGAVNNQNNLPPWNLPSQQALSGIRSREFGDNGGNSANGRSNHLILDDTQDKIQAQFKSDYQHSQISLGHIARIEDNAGRKDERGEGLEARTDGAAVVRAAKGLLLTTDGRARAEGGMLSRDELVGCLEQALHIAKSLGQAASTHEGGTRNSDPQQNLTEVVDALGHGVGDEVGKTSSAPAGQPVIAMSAPGGIASATPKDQTHYAGQNIDTVAGGNQQHYAMGDILHTAKNNIEQYAIDGDLRQIANKGKVIHQAQSNLMELTADKSLAITSVNDGATVSAKKYILLQVGESYIRMTPDMVVINGRILKHQSDAPSMPAAIAGAFVLPVMSEAAKLIDKPAFSQRLDLSALSSHFIGPEHNWVNVPFEARDASGKLLLTGATDQYAMTSSIFTESEEEITIMIGEDGWDTEEELALRDDQTA
ncbi:type VI secretion system Vgr family protein [Glaciimonas soli]|uniref:Type VI secretion system tip protein VgrG n=1 Tax=Glaciimonas soli TaxID=2590999 RepID=A0A843YY41_9BURK|nr:type VI secretion system Vgr family protein [Glaciimonas soli]MQR02102.1 type VI secretion system tip protein VgrG [Glaciimonas soli]